MNRWLKLAAVLLFCAPAARAQIFTWTTNGDKVGNSDITSMVLLHSYGLGDMVSAANGLKAKPAGKRCLLLASDNHAIFNEPADMLPGKLRTLWWPAGVAKSQANEQLLIARLSAAGVKPDMITLDDEDAPNRWNLTAANIAAIAADPRGAAMGVVPFNVYDDVAGLNFDTISSRAARTAARTAIFAPLLNYAPNAKAASYGDLLISASEGQILREFNNHPQFSDSIAGTVQNLAVYGSKGLNPQTQSPFAVAMYTESFLRVAANHGETWPWYSGDNVDHASWSGTLYWSEAIRHGLLTCGLKGFLFDADQPTAASKFSAVYTETKNAVGGTMPTTLCSTDIVDPTSTFYVTARADNWSGTGSASRIVGRVSFGPGVTTATFTVAGQTFTVKPTSGQAGAWFSYQAPSGGSTTTGNGSTTTTGSTTKKTVKATPTSGATSGNSSSGSTGATGGNRILDPIHGLTGR